MTDAIRSIADERTRAFAVACYDTNSIEELQQPGRADPADLAAWGITPEQWREAIDAALADRLAADADE